MVTNVTNLSRSGLADWLIQRVSALILAAYVLCIVGFLLTHGDVDYWQWKIFITSTWMQIFTVLSLIALVWHAWIGLWTISTDYLTEQALGRLGTPIRLVFQLFCMLVLFAYVVWGVQILWGLN